MQILVGIFGFFAIVYFMISLWKMRDGNYITDREDYNMRHFNECFYTDDFDQEMLDFIEENYTITPNGRNEWNVGGKFLRYYNVNGYFWIGSAVHPNYRHLTKQQFKEKIKMTNNNDTFPVEDLKTGMILRFKNGDITMVLKGTANGDIFGGGLSGMNRYCSSNPVVEIYQPRSNIHFSIERFKYSFNDSDYKLIWKKEDKSDKQLRLEELERKQRELADEISKLSKDV